MIRLFHKASSEAPLELVDEGELDRVTEASMYFWLDVVGEEPERIHEIAGRLGIDRPIVEEAIEFSLLPRVDEYETFISIVLHNLVTGGGDRLSTGEVDMFIGDRYLVTIHDGHLPASEWLQNGVGRASTKVITSPAHLAASIALLMSRRFTDVLDELDGRVNDLEDLAMTADPRSLNEIYVLRREVVFLQRSTGPHREVFRHLSRSVHPVIDANASRAFDNVYDHQVQIAETLESARSLLSSDLETYRGAVADQTNEIVRVLTVFSAILLPLTLVTGVWGMNFANLPLAAQRWGFFILLGIMAVIASSFWFFFVRRGFIGRPRIGELPKSVGLGLVQIGVAPIKVVSSGIETTVRAVGRTLGAGTEGTTADTPPKDGIDA